MRNVTKAQHYVPQFYLKQFGTVDTTKKESVTFYQFDNLSFKENIPPKSICYENYFYGKNSEMEKIFSEKETKWAKSIRAIAEIRNGQLEVGVIALIKEFAIYQYLRTPAMLDHMQKMMDAVNQELFQQMGLDKGDSPVKLKAEIVDIIEAGEELLREIKDLSVAVVRFNTLNKLITSDMPIIVMNPFTPDSVGLANIGVVIMFPVAVDVLVIIYDNKVYSKILPYSESCDEKDVEAINQYQVINAYERIIAKDKTQLEYLLTESVLNERNLLLIELNTDTAQYKKSTLLVMHSKKLRYTYQISFLKLPHDMKKIPLECREVFPRKYDRNEWIKLCVLQYQFPKRMEKDIAAIDRGKMEKGYALLRKCMENYWNMPLEERTITPILMKNILSTQTRFFKKDDIR